MLEEKPLILLFDGVCNLCNASVQFLIKHDPKALLKFAALQSESGQALLKKYGLNTTDFDSFILIENNLVYSKSTAILRLVKQLGGFFKGLYYLIYIPRSIRDFIYDLIAKSRYSIFGKRNRCMVPNPEIMDRFL